MFKFIVISIICFYLLFKVVGLLFRVLFSAMGSNTPPRSVFGSGGFSKNNSKRRPASGNINVDYIPEDKSKKEFKGGEYVDYEEVK
ncbi:MAG TPA: DUF4834 family protein [Cytophagales bacterium]|nr:DUF4834 family protein [Cytophagales bacterium]